jgi:hypothetical protein
LSCNYDATICSASEIIEQAVALEQTMSAAGRYSEAHWLANNCHPACIQPFQPFRPTLKASTAKLFTTRLKSLLFWFAKTALKVIYFFLRLEKKGFFSLRNAVVA